MRLVFFAPLDAILTAGFLTVLEEPFLFPFLEAFPHE